MSFEAAKCPSCGANIQVPTDTERANCMYCGRQIIVKDAISKHKIEVSGTVTVENDIESMLKSAEGFLMLEKWAEAEKLLAKIIEQDSTDYRGWWGRFLVKTKNLESVSQVGNDIDTSDADTAILLAPESIRLKLKHAFDEYTRKNKKYTLIINRENQLYARKYRVVVTMNNEIIARLENGGSISHVVPPGNYSLCFNLGQHKTVAVFNVQGDILIDIKIRSSIATVKASIQGSEFISYSEKY